MEAPQKYPLFIGNGGKSIIDSQQNIVRFGDDPARIKTIIPTVGGSVKIANSSIPNGGKGLFAERAFEEKEIVTFYDGAVAQKVPFKEIMDCYKTHARKLGREHTLFGNFTESGEKIDLSEDDYSQVIGKGGGAFLNDGKEKNNCAWYDLYPSSHLLSTTEDPFQIVVLLYALRPIKKGEELFISYGVDYWKNEDKSMKREPKFIKRDKYYRKKQEEEENRANRLKNAKRIMPTPVLTTTIPQESNKKQKTGTCMHCSKPTSLVDVHLNAFFCKEACRQFYQ